MTQMSDKKRVDALGEINVKYYKNTGEPAFDPLLCRTLVGRLIYLTATQPNSSCQPIYI